MMQKFDFRLEPVLKLREAREEQATLEQARALEEYRVYNDNLNCAKEKLNQASQSDLPDNSFDYFNRLTYCEHMSREVKNIETGLKKKHKQLKKCRHNLVQAMQERSVMENLKEKQLESYKFVANTYAQKETDEVAIQQFLRRNK